MYKNQTVNKIWKKKRNVLVSDIRSWYAIIKNTMFVLKIYQYIHYDYLSSTVVFHNDSCCKLETTLWEWPQCKRKFCLFGRDEAIASFRAKLTAVNPCERSQLDKDPEKGKRNWRPPHPLKGIKEHQKLMDESDLGLFRAQNAISKTFQSTREKQRKPEAWWQDYPGMQRPHAGVGPNFQAATRKNDI